MVSVSLRVNRVSADTHSIVLGFKRGSLSGRAPAIEEKRWTHAIALRYLTSPPTGRTAQLESSVAYNMPIGVRYDFWGPVGLH